MSFLLTCQLRLKVTVELNKIVLQFVLCFIVVLITFRSGSIISFFRRRLLRLYLAQLWYVHYTIEHRAVLIILPLILHTVVIAQLLSVGRITG